MDEQEFEEQVEPHRRELQAHCYRMLGSLQDAEDALQETLVAAWRGIDSFEGRSSLRTWLYRIATNVCLRQAARRPPRLLSWDHLPALGPNDVIGEPVLEPIWLDPWPTDPAEAFARRETIGLAYVAALQHLTPNQRAVLVLRDVLAFSAVEVADLLDTSPASVNSALQRARAGVADLVDSEPEEHGQHHELVEAFVDAWERSDVDALVEILSEDVAFTMPPLPAWFDGRADVLAFFGRRVFERPWRLVPVVSNAQPGFACYQWDGRAYVLGAVNVLSFTGDRISWIAAFVDPSVVARYGLPEILDDER